MKRMSNRLVARMLHISEQGLRVQARERPELLGFPVVCVRSSVIIMDEPFFRYFYKEDWQEELNKFWEENSNVRTESND